MGTITKAVNLLSHFSSERAEIGLASFVRLSGGDKATTRRHLVELEQNGFLEQHPVTRSYRLGPAVLRLASIREKHFPVRSAVKLEVDKLADTLGELVHASLVQGTAMSPIYHKDTSRHGLRVIFDEGELLPFDATASGLAMVAFGPAELTDTVLSGEMPSYAPNTVIARSDMAQLIKCTQNAGYSFSDQYFTREIVSFGMPFFGSIGHAIGTLAVPLQRSRLTNERAVQILSTLRPSCERITQSCGGTIPETLQATWNAGFKFDMAGD